MKTGVNGRALLVLLVGLCACESGDKAKSAGGPAPASPAMPTAAAAPVRPTAKPAPTPPPEVNVPDSDLATEEDYAEDAEKAITDKTWQAELDKLAKEIGE